MRSLLFLPFLFCGFAATAQTTAKPARVPKLTDYVSGFTFSPLALAQIDNTLMLGAEHEINYRFHLTLEGGWIFHSSYFGAGNDVSRNASGFIFRPGAKLFFSSLKQGYFQPQFFYKQVTHTMYDWLEKDVVNGTPSYQQLQEFKFRRKVHGYHGIFGVLRPIGHNERFYMDVYAGLGVRYKWTKVVGEKNSRYNRQGEFFFRNEEEGAALPSVPFGFRLLVMID